jgi:hypothetical protein
MANLPQRDRSRRSVTSGNPELGSNASSPLFVSPGSAIHRFGPFSSPAHASSPSEHTPGPVTMSEKARGKQPEGVVPERVVQLGGPSIDRSRVAGAVPVRKKRLAGPFLEDTPSPAQGAADRAQSFIPSPSLSPVRGNAEIQVSVEREHDEEEEEGTDQEVSQPKAKKKEGKKEKEEKKKKKNKGKRRLEDDEDEDEDEDADSRPSATPSPGRSKHGESSSSSRSNPPKKRARRSSTPETPAERELSWTPHTHASTILGGEGMANSSSPVARSSSPMTPHSVASPPTSPVSSPAASPDLVSRFEVERQLRAQSVYPPRADFTIDDAWAKLIGHSDKLTGHSDGIRGNGEEIAKMKIMMEDMWRRLGMDKDVQVEEKSTKDKKQKQREKQGKRA